MEAFQTFISTLLTIGVVFFAVGQWRAGRDAKTGKVIEEASSTIKVLESRANAFEKDLKDARVLHERNREEIIRLQEAIKHKDIQIEQYYKIITNRNPELESVLKDVRNFLQVLSDKIGDGFKIVKS